MEKEADYKCRPAPRAGIEAMCFVCGRKMHVFVVTHKKDGGCIAHVAPCKRCMSQKNG